MLKITVTLYKSMLHYVSLFFLAFRDGDALKIF